MQQPRYLGLVVLLFAGMEGREECEEITIPMCMDIGYNRTRLPNQFNHATQDEAGMEVHQFWPLVKIECSPDLRFFLCSMYTPICIDTYPKPLPACRSVCERAKKGCLPVMQKYGFDWPSRMSCSRLPPYGGKELCMDAQAQDPKSPDPDLRPDVPAAPPRVRWDGCSCGSCGRMEEQSGNLLISLRPGNRLYNQSVRWAGQEDCAAPCYSPFFNSEDRKFTELWLTVWSIICSFSTVLTFATFLLDPSRFHYPERSIMYLSLCYFVVSLGFIIRISVGHKALSCDLQNPSEVHSYANLYLSRTNLPTLESDSGELLCSLVFVLIYLFSMSSSIWWVILTLTWFLSAGLKWAEESVSSYSVWFHAAAWILPAAKTTALLLMSAVEGDAVSGICYAATRNTAIQLGFVIVPLFIYLLLGITFLAGGFISLFQIRSIIRSQTGPQNTDKLEKLIVKIGIFGILYIIPAGTFIACNVYEVLNLQTWEESYLCRGCQKTGEESFPDFSVFMLKHLMQLTVGITAGFWIWSAKTLEAWRSVFCRLFDFRRFSKTVTNGKKMEGKSAPLPPLPRAITSNSVPAGVENHYSTIPRGMTALTHV